MKTRSLTLACALVIAGPWLGSAADAGAQVRPSPPPAPRMLERPEAVGPKEPSLAPGAEVTAYEMSWTHDGAEAAGRRLAAAAEVLLGGDAARRAFDDEAVAKAVHGAEAGSWTRLGATPVLARYQKDLDEFRLIHEELDRVSRPGRDLGEEGAREVAEKLLELLGKSGAIDARLYRNAALQVGYKMVGAGPVDGPVEPGRIVEYRFTYRPRLDGFEMANAGVRLGILASGELASLRVGGVTPVGEWRGDRLVSPMKNAAREVRVGVDELMKRFYGGVPEGAEPQVAWSRVMYAMPEGATRATVEPMLIVSYSLQSQSDGRAVVSRRKMLGYSLTDPGAAPVDFDAPPAKHEGSEPTRKDGKAG